jgi:hypothetical protein
MSSVKTKCATLMQRNLYPSFPQHIILLQVLFIYYGPDKKETSEKFPTFIICSPWFIQKKWTQVSLYWNGFFTGSYQGTQLDMRKVFLIYSMCHMDLTLYLNLQCLVCFSSDALSLLPTDLNILIRKRSHPWIYHTWITQRYSQPRV